MTTLQRISSLGSVLMLLPKNDNLYLKIGLYHYTITLTRTLPHGVTRDTGIHFLRSGAVPPFSTSTSTRLAELLASDVSCFTSFTIPDPPSAQLTRLPSVGSHLLSAGEYCIQHVRSSGFQSKQIPVDKS